MHGREVLLILAHLFRKLGSPVAIVSAVEFLSFRCRYGPPSSIRQLLAWAADEEMISREGHLISANFLYDLQKIPPNQASALQEKVCFNNDVKPMT